MPSGPMRMSAQRAGLVCSLLLLLLASDFQRTAVTVHAWNSDDPNIPTTAPADDSDYKIYAHGVFCEMSSSYPITCDEVGGEDEAYYEGFGGGIASGCHECNVGGDSGVCYSIAIFGSTDDGDTWDDFLQSGSVTCPGSMGIWQAWSSRISKAIGQPLIAGSAILAALIALPVVLLACILGCCIAKSGNTNAKVSPHGGGSGDQFVSLSSRSPAR